MAAIPVSSTTQPNTTVQASMRDTVQSNDARIEVLEKSGIRYGDAVLTQTVVDGDTDHATSGEAVYEFVTDAVGDLIVQTVTNGDTTHTPSGDAVFDAIAAAVAGIPVVTAWTNVTFTNSWLDYDLVTPYQRAQYRKNGDVVELRGHIKNGTLGTSAFTLPAGFRPPALLEFDGQYGTATSYLVVNTNGTVVINSGANTYVGLNRIQFSITT